jgi:hypothetical protein
MALPANAKMTALVWSGRSRPKLIHGSPKLNSGLASSSAMTMPTSMPTRPHTSVASRNHRTIASSYTNRSIRSVTTASAVVTPASP